MSDRVIDSSKYVRASELIGHVEPIREDPSTSLIDEYIIRQGDAWGMLANRYVGGDEPWEELD